MALSEAAPSCNLMLTKPKRFYTSTTLVFITKYLTNVNAQILKEKTIYSFNYILKHLLCFFILVNKIFFSIQTATIDKPLYFNPAVRSIILSFDTEAMYVLRP